MNINVNTVARNTKKALGKNLPEILEEQAVNDITIIPVNGIEYPCSNDITITVYETPEQMVRRKNNELQGCF